MTPPTTFLPDEAPAAVCRLPKVNLHTHLEGSLRPTTVWELAHAQGLDLGIPRQSIDAAVQVDGTEHDLGDYLQKISFAYPLLRDKEALRRAAFEAAEDAANDGVIYFELRAGPLTHTHPGLPLEEVILHLLQGLRQAEDQFDLTCRLIISALRHHAPQDNLRLAQVAAAFRSEGVVGFDLAGDEARFPAEIHAEAFNVARQAGLGITVHAGEAGSPENVRFAVEVLGATRVGHGVAAIHSREVLTLLKDRRILLEICPTSNVHTRAVEAFTRHPARRFYQHGIPISIGDDDPVTSRTRVSKELALLRARLGFDPVELRETQLMGAQAAFLEDTARQRDLETALRSADWRSAFDSPAHCPEHLRTSPKVDDRI